MALTIILCLVILSISNHYKIVSNNQHLITKNLTNQKRKQAKQCKDYKRQDTF